MNDPWSSRRLRGAVAFVAAVLSISCGKQAPPDSAASPPVAPLDALAERHGLERVDDDSGRQAAATLLSPFADISGDVVTLDAVMRRADAGSTLWLIDYRSRVPGARLHQGRRPLIDVPLLAIVVELDDQPDWPTFRQSPTTPAPPGLPAAWHPRLAAMSEYRMGIDGKVVAFFSQLQTDALVHIAESGTSPEFHPGLRNSALAVDVQRALDLVGALPQASSLARFMRIEGATPDLPATDRAPLDQMNARIAQAQAETRRAADDATRAMDEAREEFRRRNEANNEQFRRNMAETMARMRAGRDGAAASTQPAPTSDPVDDQAAAGANRAQAPD